MDNNQEHNSNTEHNTNPFEQVHTKHFPSPSTKPTTQLYKNTISTHDIYRYPRTHVITYLCTPP